ncbi:MAG TPA: hypothetical protein VGO85_16115 [Caldimonas sp.]|jgi:hypothetical protein|nr:hypothetical protein [Caldimonas sp.]
MIRLHRLLAALLVLASAGVAAQEKRYEPKALARYDVSYVRCEDNFADMKGHRDEAYLNLWRIKPGPKATARLAEARNSATYKAEHQRALRQAVKAGDGEAAKTLRRECRGLWSEMDKTPKPAK